MAAIQIDHTPFPSAGSRARRVLLGKGRTATAILCRWWQRRRAMRQLAEASDVMLRDIGLTRGSVESVVRHGRR